MPIISGVVRDKNGVPAGRTLRIYRRDTGELLGTTSSAFTPAVPEDPHLANVVSFLTVSPAGVIVDLTGAALSIIGTPTIAVGGVYAAQSAVLGPGVYLHRPISDFGAGVDYTIEGFVSNDATTSAYAAIASLLTSGGTRSTFMLNGGEGRPVWDGTWRFPSGTLPGSSTAAVKHIALCKSGNNYTLHVDGALVSTTTWTGSPLGTHATNRLVVGASDNVGNESGGRLRFEQIRITKNVARYGTSFTPPAGGLRYAPGGVPEKPLGIYTFETPYTGEVQVVHLDDRTEAPIENDMIHRTFPV